MNFFVIDSEGGLQVNLDDEILDYLSQGNDKGIELIIRYYGSLLKAVVNKHLFSLKVYQGECLNDTLLAIWNNWDKFDSDKSTFKNWICAIARYRAINYLKKYSYEFNEVKLEDVSPYLMSQQEGPLSRELWEIELSHILEPLSPQDQQIFIELFMEEQTIDEVAKKYNMSKENLYQRVSRGRKKMRRKKANDTT